MVSPDCSEPCVQLLVTDSTDTGMAFGVTAALTFLFLLGLYCLSQIVAVLRSKHAADLAVLPEEALAAGIRLVIVVSDPVDQNCFASRFFLITISSIVLIRRRGSPETTKAPQ